MSTMTMRIDDVDAAVVRKYAKFEGKTISDFIRDAVFEKIETQDDLAALRAAVEEDDGTRYTHAQVQSWACRCLGVSNTPRRR